MTFNSLLRGVVISVLIVACSGGGGGGSTGPGVNPSPPPAPPPPPPPPPPASGANNIIVANNNYTPSTQTISRGATVNWTWNTCSGDYGLEQCARHTVTFDDGQSSAEQDQGSYSRTFNVAGQFKYHCTIHGQAMSGTITVQ